MELLSTEMLVCLKKSEQDGVALLGLLEPYPFKVLMKTILRLPQRFARDRYGIINAFLQHLRLEKVDSGPRIAFFQNNKSGSPRRHGDTEKFASESQVSSLLIFINPATQFV